jgi:hypothetical protein
MGFGLALFRTSDVPENIGSFDSLKKFPYMVDPVSHALFDGDPISLKDSHPDLYSSSSFSDMRGIILESSTQGEISDHLSMIFFENVMDFVHNSRISRVLDQL